MRSATMPCSFAAAARSSSALFTGVPFTARITSPRGCRPSPPGPRRSRRPGLPCRRSPCAPRRERTDRDAELALPLRLRRGRLSHLRVLRLADRDRDLLRLAVAPHARASLACPVSSPRRGGSSLERSIGLPSSFSTTSPGLRPAFSAGLSFFDRGHQRAARLLEAERAGERLGHLLDRHAEPAARDASVLHELVLHVQSRRRSGSRTRRPGSRRCGDRSAS